MSNFISEILSYLSGCIEDFNLEIDFEEVSNLFIISSEKKQEPMIYNITNGNSPDSDPDGGAILNNFVLGNQNELPILGDHNPFNVDHLSIR